MKDLILETKIYPNAKLNLYLEIIAKRDDGYHLLETIMTPIKNLHDEIDVKLYKSGDIEIKTIGLNLKKEDNLVFKVLKALKLEFNLHFGIDIILKKNIPTKAGLGGGSSDAAFIVKLINNYFKFATLDRLISFTVKFGADIPFFLINKSSFCEGVGEIITPIEIPKLNFELYTPDYPISTVKVFKNRENFISKENLFGKSLRNGKNNIKDIWNILKKTNRLYFNRLEESLYLMEPELFELKKRIKNSEEYHLTGSGSTFYKIQKES